MKNKSLSMSIYESLNESKDNSQEILDKIHSYINDAEKKLKTDPKKAMNLAKRAKKLAEANKKMLEKKESSLYGNINGFISNIEKNYLKESVEDVLKKDDEFRYQLLGRLKSDCDYYLGNGNRKDKSLWAGNVKDQIQTMKDLYSSFSDDMKPDWISMEDIDNYEKEMTNDLGEADEHDLSKDLYGDEANRRIHTRLEFLDVYLEGLEKALKNNDADNITLNKSKIKGNIEYLIPALNIKGGVSGLIDYLQNTDFDFENRFKETASLLKDFSEIYESDTNEVTAGNIKQKAQEILPAEDIETHDGDLYLKVSDKSTELVNKMKDKDSGLLKTFKSEKDGQMWYDIPFANMEDDYKDKVNEEATVFVNDTAKELDFQITDVTVLEPVADGDVLPPDMQSLLVMADQELTESEGADWGHINILSSRAAKDGTKSNALFELRTPTKTRLMSFVLEGEGALKEFSVYNSMGQRKFVKKTTTPVSVMKEFINQFVAEDRLDESDKSMKEVKPDKKAIKKVIEEFLSHSMTNSLLPSMYETIKANIETYNKNKENSKTGDRLGPTMYKKIREKINGFVSQLPTCAMAGNHDNYKVKDGILIYGEESDGLNLKDYDSIIDALFGSEWLDSEVKSNKEIDNAKEKTLEKVNESVDDFEIKGLNGNAKDVTNEFKNAEAYLGNLSPIKIFKIDKDYVVYKNTAKDYSDWVYSSDSKDNIEGWLYGAVQAKNRIVESVVPSPYRNITIGDIVATYNVNTGEIVYSIPAKNINDKKKNINDIEKTDIPYDTETIIRNYIETNVAQAPEVEDSEEVKTDVNPNGSEDVEVKDTEKVDEADEEPDVENPAQNGNGDEEAITDETQSETGSAFFFLKPKSVEFIQDAMRKGVSQGKSTYVVVKTVNLPKDQFDEYCSDLQGHYSFLEDINISDTDTKNFSFNVVKVTCNDADYSVLADPVGYDYSRYAAVI